jgi:hypothetical protein
MKQSTDRAEKRQQFLALGRKILSTPKAKIDERDRQWHASKASEKKKPE